jgi:hypothetical protein
VQNLESNSGPRMREMQQWVSEYRLFLCLGKR